MPGLESEIVQLDFSAAFDRVSQSDLLFKLKSIIGVGAASKWPRDHSGPLNVLL